LPQLISKLKFQLVKNFMSRNLESRRPVTAEEGWFDSLIRIGSLIHSPCVAQLLVSRVRLCWTQQRRTVRATTLHWCLLSISTAAILFVQCTNDKC